MPNGFEESLVIEDAAHVVIVPSERLTWERDDARNLARMNSVLVAKREEQRDEALRMIRKLRDTLCIARCAAIFGTVAHCDICEEASAFLLRHTGETRQR